MKEKQAIHCSVTVTQINYHSLNKRNRNFMYTGKKQSDLACFNETKIEKKHYPNLESYTVAGNTKHSRLEY